MKNKRKYWLIGVGVFLFAVCTLLIYILAPAYLDVFLLFFVGCVLCAVAIDLIVITYSFKEKVFAVLVGYGFERFKAHISSSPIFTYQYQGKTYTTSAAECLSLRYVLKHYKEGETYTIYISPKNPSIFITQRKIRIFDIALFLIGSAIAILSIYIAFQT